MNSFNSNGDHNLSKATKRMMAKADEELPQQYLPLLNVGQQAAQQSSSANAALSPAASVGSTGTWSSSSSMSEFLNSARLSPALPNNRPAARKANAPTRKRGAVYDHEQVTKFPEHMNSFSFNGTSPTQPLFGTSTKKFAQDSSKSPEFALPSLGTFTTCTAAQFNAMIAAMCNFPQEQIQGLLKSFPVVHGTPIESSDAQGSLSTSSTVMDSRLNAGGPITNWAGGNGGTTPGFGFAPLSGPGFFSSITWPNATSLSVSSTTFPAPSQLIPTNWPDFFAPPFKMPLSPYDIPRSDLPTKDEINKYCSFLFKARVQADLHRLETNRGRRFTTETYHQLLAEATKNEMDIRALFQHPMIEVPRTLFNSENSQGVPQTVRIEITDPGIIFHKYQRTQGVPKPNDLWISLEKTNPREYHAWCKKAIQIDQEQLRQLVKGFIAKGKAYFKGKANGLNDKD